jgi:hypothetical protein
LPTDFQELSFTSPQTGKLSRHYCKNNKTAQTKNARDRYLAQAFRD